MAMSADPEQTFNLPKAVLVAVVVGRLTITLPVASQTIELTSL